MLAPVCAMIPVPWDVRFGPHFHNTENTYKYKYNEDADTGTLSSREP